MVIPSDLEIAQKANLLHINEIAEQMGLDPERDLEHYGKYVAKDQSGSIGAAARSTERQVRGCHGDYTDAAGRRQIDHDRRHRPGDETYRQERPSSPSASRRRVQPLASKGGAAGGGYSQIVPMENFNLHLTGDIHAISAAHNLIAAMLDAHIYHGNMREIDMHNIPWRRVVDLNDRALRNIVIGLGKRFDGVPRESGYDITVASEIMAILALTTSLQDMRERIGRMVVAYDKRKTPVSAEDIGAAGAATVLMKEAIKPNLMQSLENTPALVHAGPFANIAHGNSSIIADLIAMKTGEYVVTESGFGADIGAEKFFNIKSRVSGLKPNAVVLVTTIRALKAHTGKYTIIPGKQIDPALKEENVADVQNGAANMVRHLENLMKFGVNPVVAINVFADDTDKEIAAVREIALAAGATGVSVARHWAQGGAGAAELAEMIVSACDMPNDFRLLYPDDMSIKDKIETIATEIYRADGVDYAPIAQRKIRTI